MTLRRRIATLEQRAGIGGGWFDLATWKAENAAGVSVDERERRRLAEHPQHAGEIRRLFARIRARRAVIAGLEELPSDGDPI